MMPQFDWSPHATRPCCLRRWLLLAGCSAILGPGVQVTQTGGQMAPVVHRSRAIPRTT